MAIITRVGSMSGILSSSGFLLSAMNLLMLRLFFLAASSYTSKTQVLFFFPSFLSLGCDDNDWFYSALDSDWDSHEEVLTLLRPLPGLLVAPTSINLQITPAKLDLCFIFALVPSSLLSPVFSQCFKTPSLLRLSFKQD